MLDTKQRNTEINQIIKSTVIDFCRIFDGGYLVNEDAIFADYNDEDLFYVFADFNDKTLEIMINCFVFSISHLAKLLS